MAIVQQLEQKGIQPGRQEARNEGKLLVARTILQNSIERITAIKMTGLSEYDLAPIRHRVFIFQIRWPNGSRLGSIWLHT